MIEFVRFHPEHAVLVDVQPVQGAEAGIITLADVQMLKGTFAFSGFVGGRCVGCAGLVNIWPNRSLAWALFSADVGPHMRQIIRFVRQVLPTYPDRRIEASVLAGFRVGERFLELCGFEREGVMRNYDPLGRTFLLYARIKP